MQRRALLLPQELRALGKTKAIIFAENCKPILCDKNRYHDDPQFMPRLAPPITIAPIDFELHQAIVQQRVRELKPDEPFERNALVQPLALPPLDDQQNPSDASLAQTVDAKFAFHDMPSREQTQAAIIKATLAREAAKASKDLADV